LIGNGPRGWSKRKRTSRATAGPAGLDSAADDGFRLFHPFLTALDNEYLAFEAERAKAEAKKREGERGA
jgi:hypothetical protein